jgi:hypothetical protein
VATRRHQANFIVEKITQRKVDFVYVYLIEFKFKTHRMVWSFFDTQNTRSVDVSPNGDSSVRAHLLVDSWRGERNSISHKPKPKRRLGSSSCLTTANRPFTDVSASSLYSLAAVQVGVTFGDVAVAKERPYLTSSLTFWYQEKETSEESLLLSLRNLGETSQPAYKKRAIV